jgi:hypothetical protein
MRRSLATWALAAVTLAAGAALPFAACAGGGGANVRPTGSEARNMNRTDDAATPTPPAPTEPAAGEAELKNVELTATVRREPDLSLVVEYRVANRGASPVLLLNRGDTTHGLGAGKLYVEPRPDGVLRLTQQAYALPADYRGPGPTAPIHFGVSTLAAGAEVSETLKLSPPLRRSFPYARYYPEQPVPDPPKKVQFCLGVVSAAGAKTTDDGGVRVLADRRAAEKQNLLCGPVQNL